MRTWPSRQGCALMAATTSGVAGRGSSSSKKTAEPITSPWWITAMRLPAFCPVKPNIACARSPWWPDSPCWYLVSEWVSASSDSSTSASLSVLTYVRRLTTETMPTTSTTTVTTAETPRTN